MIDIHIYLFQLSLYFLLYALFISYSSYHSGSMTSSLIKKGIKIYRFDNGIAHIEVDNKYDAQFGLGFVHAEDRLWQLYFSYLIFNGELSKILKIDVSTLDRFSHVLNSKGHCKESLKNLDDDENKLMQSYADGVNFYLDNTTILPIEFYLLSIKVERWDIYKTCMALKLTELLMTHDFLADGLRTYMKEKLNTPVTDIEALFPYHLSHMERKTTVVKENEVDQSIKPPTKEEYEVEEKDYNHYSLTNNHIYDQKSEENKNIKKNDAHQDNLGLYGHGGSNNCIISGKHTKSGFPILCNDPHLLNNIPAFWYVASIYVKEDNFKILGVSHPGHSCVLIGQNGYIMWGVTNGLTDTSNIVRLEKVSENTYMLDGKEKEVEFRYEEICNGKSCQKMKFLQINNVGPILNGFFNDIYNFYEHGIIGSDLFDEDKYFYVLRSDLCSEKSTGKKMLAKCQYNKTTEEVRLNMMHFTLPTNLVFADKEGNIYYQHAGQIPISYDENGNVIDNSRKSLEKNKHLGYIQTIKYSNQLTSHFIPFYDLPFVKNPEKGFIVSANNNVAPENYPYFIPGGYYNDYRAVTMEIEIEKMIKETGSKITPEMVNERLINNIKDTWCDELISIFKILTNDEGRIISNPLFYELLKFDCVFSYDSKQALLFNSL